jgi:hypothetical protein
MAIMKTRVRNQFLKILIGGLFAVFAISFTHFSDFNAHDVKGEEANSSTALTILMKATAILQSTKSSAD